ncbi:MULTISPECIES: glycosyltransferase family 9 protein [Clostridium]|jgi:ADP-heptose:LPS heptosyltransferase|nr:MULTISPECIES: glycosyltransferase family 9 protein [Clostridium]MBD9191231.1 lipopolysaccharide heptosyltransferase family protein [Roseburia inulinivorans]RHS70941.1 lipopolysaccharide heptosyltransferase family protein [Clostridium sp. AM43-3BH]
MRIKEKIRKIKNRLIDSKFLFTHSHLMRNMVESIEDELISQNGKKDDILYISFYPTGGFGDYIISSKLLDEISQIVPCKIDVYCENVTFGKAVYEGREKVEIFPINTFYSQMWKYDLALKVEHFIHIEKQNANKIAKINPIFMDKLNKLGHGYRTYYPDVEQQWFRENIHFRRCEIKGINRWTELSHEGIFKIEDQKTWIPMREEYKKRLQELGLNEKKYITLNRGADSMGRSKMQTKVWPLEHYNDFVVLFKNQYPDIEIVQVGASGNAKIRGVDKYILGESLEVTKWILKGSILHLDCEGGLVHLATQLDTKCAVVFGPTPKHFYEYPQNINMVYEGCNNCMGTHPEWAFECYKGLSEPECMYKVTPEIVMKNIKSYMDSIRKEEK